MHEILPYLFMGAQALQAEAANIKFALALLLCIPCYLAFKQVPHTIQDTTRQKRAIKQLIKAARTWSSHKTVGPSCGRDPFPCGLVVALVHDEAKARRWVLAWITASTSCEGAAGAAGSGVQTMKILCSRPALAHLMSDEDDEGEGGSDAASVRDDPLSAGGAFKVRTICNEDVSPCYKPYGWIESTKTYLWNASSLSPPQEAVATHLVKMFHAGRKVAFISGPSGTGKTRAAIWAAHLLDAAICDQCIPVRPGNRPLDVMRKAPSDKPRICFIFNESEGLLMQALTGTATLSDRAETLVTDKGSLNDMLDDFLSAHPNVFLIMTSNYPMRCLNRADPSGSVARRVHPVFLGHSEWRVWPSSVGAEPLEDDLAVAPQSEPARFLEHSARRFDVCYGDLLNRKEVQQEAPRRRASPVVPPLLVAAVAASAAALGRAIARK